jgi:Uma2 family endonuclease
MTIQIDQHTLMQQLLASPQLGLLVRKIEDVLADEAARRQHFYATITEGDKAEFINGEIIFHSPVKLRHNAAGGNLYRLLSTHVMLHDLGYVGYEKIMISLTRNDYEPDICFFTQAKAQQFRPEQMRFPAPDFVVEVLSDSTEENDRGVKLIDYAAHGIIEYWILDPVAEMLEQYALQPSGEYKLQIKANTGQVRSLAVEGFEIPVRAIFDETEHRATLRVMLAA